MFKDPRGINLTGATCDQVRIFEQILKAYIDETEEQEVNVLEKETLADSKADSSNFGF